MRHYDHHKSSAYLIPYPVKAFSKPFLLSSSVTTIGRDASNSFRIEDTSVAHRHAELERTDGGFVFKRLTSEDGCLVNEEPIEEAILNHHDKITIGNQTFLFLIGSSVTSGAPQDLISSESDNITISEEEIEPANMLAQAAHDAVQQLYHQPLEVSQFNVEQASNAHQRLSLLYQFSEKLRGTKEVKEMIDQGLGLILKAIPVADRATILLRAGERRPLEVKGVQFREGQADKGSIPISRTVLNWVLGERMALVSQDVTDDERFEDSDSIRISSPNSIVCVPLLKEKSALGVLYIETSNIFDPLTQEDAAFAAAVANELALNLENIRLQHQALRNARMAGIGLTITNLAHNIKNLIMLNQNAIELMGVRLAKFEDPKIKATWDRIQKSFDRINCLSADMLEYAKAEKSQIESVDINKLINKGRVLFGQGMDLGNVEFRFDLSPDNPKWMMDRAQLQRALINLVVNAIDATEEKEKGIIKISSAVEDGQRLVIAVADNGEGIEAEQLERISDLFFTTKGTKGSGLGLPMVQKFVQRLGGKLVVRSKPNVGSSFSMIFPVIDP
jgi:signal transduction histidine kinase